MNEYIISTTSTADLPDSYIKEHHLDIDMLSYTLEGKEYTRENSLPYDKFYKLMRDGKVPKTSACNIEQASELFEKYASKGTNIVHISFSSALSSTYNNEKVAADEVMEKYPDVKIVVIDSLGACLGQGLLVHYAVKLKEQGKSMDEVVDWLENNKLHLCHQFTVDDLNFLHRGGRVSKTVAVIGTLVNVKPVLHVDNEGRLVPLKNVRGRKKSLTSLVDNMIEQIDGYDNEIVFIGHGDCLEDAEYVRDQVKERTGISEFIIDYVGPVIGAHSGPGTIALFFLGKNR